MQTIEILIGSPRKNGNTSSLSEMFVTGLDKNKTTSRTTFLYDKEILPCTDCRGCKKGRLECVLADDMTEMYTQLDNADVMVFGTPIYWFGPSAKTKLLVDRLRPYYANKRLSGKKAVLLLPAGTGAGDCDLTIEMFKRTFEALDIKLLGSVTAEAYDVGEAEKDQDAVASIAKLVGQII